MAWRCARPGVGRGGGTQSAACGSGEGLHTEHRPPPSPPPSRRRRGAQEIKAHPFFAGVHWASLYEQAPPYRPPLTHELDTQNFEQ